jgi:dienelactone hydrolase
VKFTQIEGYSKYAKDKKSMKGTGMTYKFLAVIGSWILIIFIFGCVSERVHLQIPNGNKIDNFYFGTSGAKKRPAVLILPGASGLRNPTWKSEYRYFAKWLNKKYNFNVLVIDYRANSNVEVENIVRQHGMKTFVEQEVATALDYLRKQESVDKEKIGLIGFSLGTLLSVMTASREDTVRVLVFVSLFTSSRGRIMIERFPDASTRPILFIASSGDYIVRSEENADKIALYWSSNAKSDTKVEIVEGNLHSVDLIRGGTRLKNMVGDWLEKYLGKDTE